MPSAFGLGTGSVVWLTALHASGANPSTQQKDRVTAIRRMLTDPAQITLADAVLARPTA